MWRAQRAQAQYGAVQEVPGVAAPVAATTANRSSEHRRSIWLTDRQVQFLEEADRDAAKQTVGILRLRRAVLADFCGQYTLAMVLTLMLAACMWAGPLFLALLIQVVLGASEGQSSIEKALAWETSFVLLIFVVACARELVKGGLERRVGYRCDVCLGQLVRRARCGELPESVGKDAEDAVQDRVSGSVAIITVQAPLDLTLSGSVVVGCLAYLFLLSWQIGAVLALALAVAAIIAGSRVRLMRTLDAIRRQMACVALDRSKPIVAAPELHGNDVAPQDIQRRDVDELRDLEGWYSGAVSASAGAQAFLVMGAALVAIYFGAKSVIEDRSRYTPEELLERTLYFLAALVAAWCCQSTVSEVQEELPQTRVVARLQREQGLVEQKTLEQMKENHAQLKGVQPCLVATGVALLAVAVAWVGFLVQQGGGYTCMPISAVCSSMPASPAGPVATMVNQSFSLLGGGCVLSEPDHVLFRRCAQAMFSVERDEPDSHDMLNGVEIQAGLEVSCPSGLRAGVFAVDPARDGAIIGEIVDVNSGLPASCLDVIEGAKIEESFEEAEEARFTVDAAAASALKRAFQVRMKDPVPAFVLSGGAATQVKLRIEFDDWSDAPTFLETTMERHALRALAGSLNSAGGASAGRRLGPSPAANEANNLPLVMKGKVSRTPRRAYQSSLQIVVKVSGASSASESISLQIFIGVHCNSTLDTTCLQREVMPLTVLGRDWKAGEERKLEIGVPSKLPSLAIPCSAGVPSDCISSAVLVASGRGGFLASFSIAVLKDGHDKTIEDPMVATHFVMDSLHACEGSEGASTLDCVLELAPEPAPPSRPGQVAHAPELPSASDAGECRRRKACPGDLEPGPPPSAEGTAYAANLLKRVDYDLSPSAAGGDDEDVQVAWSVWVSMETRSATRFAYRVTGDCGCASPRSNFKLDPEAPAFQQTSPSSYPKYCLSPTRDFAPWSTVGLGLAQIVEQCEKPTLHERGHLVPPSHFNHDRWALEATGYMTNVLPMAGTMRRGAWRMTDELIDCNRDLSPILVIGGAVYDESKATRGTLGYNGHGLFHQWTGDAALKGRRRWFWDTHHVETPTYFWKVLYAESDDAGLEPLAFWIPNHEGATRENLEKFAVSLQQLEELLEVHGQVSQRVHLRERLAWVGDDKETRELVSELEPWLKQLATCRKSGPREAWKREYCRMQRVVMPYCEAAVDDEEAHCAAVANSRFEYAQKVDGRCNRYKEAKTKIVDSMDRKPTRKIAGAANACEEAVMDVCVLTLCPTYAAIEKHDAEECEVMCEETRQAMWGTGSLTCHKDESWGDCYDDLHKSLKTDGRLPELEALMREITLKCICVTWRDDTSICYEGGLGIPRGRKWCEFDAAPSWRQLLQRGREDGVDLSHIPPPQCLAKQMVPNVTTA